MHICVVGKRIHVIHILVECEGWEGGSHDTIKGIQLGHSVLMIVLYKSCHIT